MDINFSKHEKESYIAPKIISSDAPLVPIKDAPLGMVKIIGHISNLAKRSTKKTHLQLYELTVQDKSGAIRGVWFNAPYLEYLDTSKEYIFLGRMELHGNEKSLMNPVFTSMDDYKSWLRRIT